ncbi:MAG: hypothetical protein WD552_01310 [Candidatus Paceibacterota bacterium]
MKKAHGITLSFVTIANILVTFLLFSHLPEQLATVLSVWIAVVVFACTLLLLEYSGGILSQTRGTVKAPFLGLAAGALMVSSIMFPFAWMSNDISGFTFLTYLAVIGAMTTYYLRKEEKFEHTPTIIWERDK